MASAVIGALRVTLGIDTAAFSAGLQNASARLEAWNKKITPAVNAATKLAGAASLAAGAQGILVSKAVAAGSAIGDLAVRLGIAAEAVQEFSYAATQSGSSQEAFVTSMTRMTAALGEAERGSKTAQAEFRSLGIGIEDIRGKAPDQVFEMVADRISRIEDPLRRNAALMKMFGRSGAEMAELVSDGARGISRLREEARKLGLVLSNAEVAKLKEAGDKIDIISRAAQTASQKFAVGFLPALEHMARIMTSPQFQEGARKTGELIGKIVTVMADNADAVERVVGALVGMKLGRIAGAPGALAGGLAGVFAPELLDMLVGGGEQKPGGGPLRVDITKFKWKPGMGGGGAGGEGGWQDEEAKQRLEALRKSLLTEAQAEQEAFAQRMIQIQDFLTQKALTQAEANELALAAEREHQQRMGEIQEQALEEQRRLQEQKLQIFSGYTSAFAGILDGIAGLVGDESEKQFEISKKLSIASAVVKGLESVVSSYAAGARIGGPPLGAAFAAAAALTTAGQIAAISRQTWQGAGKGAAAVSSGAGAASAPAAASAQQSPGQALYINLQGEVFGREQVRGLIERINGAVKDGATLISSRAIA